MRGEGDALNRLLTGVRAGLPRAVARAVTLVENGSPSLPALMAGLAKEPGTAHVIGLTGPPGVGKSTTTNALVRELRRRGHRVGVLAVDPSSPFTGGAVLGDRIRMQEHALDPQVFIRSMATRGHLGGLSVATPQALRVLDAAGCDHVLVETVGVGQSEVEVVGLADTTVVLLAPGMGDAVQAAKAGVLEIGDLFVVNKADREGAQSLVRELRSMIGLASRSPGEWKPPVLTLVAQEGQGIAELLDRIEAFADHQRSTGAYALRRRARARVEIEGLALAALRARPAWAGGPGLDQLAVDVAEGRLDAYAAAARLLERRPPDHRPAPLA